jgi:cation transport ATPase
MDPKTKVALRYVWQVLMGLVGVLFIVLGAMRVTKNPDVDNGAIILGITSIAITIYLLARGVPRFPEAGEEEVRGAMTAVDTIVPIGIFVAGVAVMFIVGAAV